MPPLVLTIKVACPAGGHEFPLPPTQGPFAILCACERAILTGSRGLARVEVLDA